MNIVFIGPFAFKPKGTVSARAFFMARALAKRGHQVTILMPPYDNPADSGRAWEQDGVWLENMALQGRRAPSRPHLTLPLRMARKAIQLNPDIIHVFKPIGYSGLAGITLRRLSGKPLVLDTDDWEGTGGWNDINPYPATWKHLFDWQERWLSRHSDAVTVVSRILQMQAWGFGVDPARVFYLPNGPDSALRAHAQVSPAVRGAVRSRLGVGDAPLALYLGHIPRRSDLDLVLDAMVHIRTRLPEARLVIAGVGDGLPALVAHARRLDIMDSVLFPGWIEHQDAPHFVAAADTVVVPYRNTLINRSKCAGKLVAAMALGKAVVASRLGENLSYIEDGRSGLLTEPGNADDLAQGLLAVLTDRDWATELGRNATKRIWESFDWDVRVGTLERIYDLVRS